jgi:hypothetical protein
MANVSFGVNLLPKANTNVTLGNSDSPWTIVSPSLIGSPTAPTASPGTNTTQIATTAFVVSACSTLVLPNVTSTDNGKFLRVVDGDWAAATVPSASGVGF